MPVKRLALLLLLVAAISPAWAQDSCRSSPGKPPYPVTPDLRDLMSARNVAMGGAYEAMGYGMEAVGGNPAAMSIFKRYAVEASGIWDVPQGFGNATIGLLDSTNALAMGISYNFVTYGYNCRRFGHLTTIALSYALADWLHIGATGKSDIIVGESNTNSITMNAGIIIRPGDWLTLGFSGHNLINNYNVDLPRYFVASASSLLFSQLTPAFDMRFDFNQQVVRYSIHAGLEWLIANTVPVRIGYEHDGISSDPARQYLAAGVGYFSSGSGIDLAYRHELAGASGRMLSLTLKLQF